MREFTLGGLGLGTLKGNFLLEENWKCWTRSHREMKQKLLCFESYITSGYIIISKTKWPQRMAEEGGEMTGRLRHNIIYQKN